MKTAFLAIAAVLIFGGGGAAGYYYFQHPANASQGDAATKPVAKQDSHGEEGGKKFEYVELDPLVLPVMGRDGVSEVISIVIAIEVEDSGKADEVENQIPRLTDAFIQDMYGVLSRQTVLKDGVLQVGEIKRRLLSVSQRVLGEGVAKDVLLQVVQQRSI